jgi:hypothetical protein
MYSFLCQLFRDLASAKNDEDPRSKKKWISGTAAVLTSSLYNRFLVEIRKP